MFHPPPCEQAPLMGTLQEQACIELPHLLPSPLEKLVFLRQDKVRQHLVGLFLAQLPRPSLFVGYTTPNSQQSMQIPEPWSCRSKLCLGNISYCHSPSSLTPPKNAPPPGKHILLLAFLLRTHTQEGFDWKSTISIACQDILLRHVKAGQSLVEFWIEQKPAKCVPAAAPRSQSKKKLFLLLHHRLLL